MGQGGKTHKLMWSVHEGRGLLTPGPHCLCGGYTPLPSILQASPSSEWQGSHQGGIRDSQALEGLGAPAVPLPLPPGKNSWAGSLFTFRYLPRPRQNPPSFVFFCFTHQSMLW